MRVFAFQGIRYTAAADPEPGRLAAPPYDQIDDARRDRLQALSPHHFAHLSRPVADPAGDPYRHAAELHRSWLVEGATARDERPALYPYVIELAGGGRRLGLTALVAYEEASVIRPHERTLEKPLADRLALLRTMGVDLEPALLLPEDDGALEGMLAEDLARLEPAVAHTDADGHRHLLHRLAEPARIAAYREALAGRPAAIADGHHRYQVGAMFARETGAEEGTAAAAKLAVLTSIAAAHLRIDPIHRALRARLDLDAIRPLALEHHPWEGDGGGAFAAAVAAAPQPAAGVWPASGGPEIWRLDPERAPATTSRGAARLAVALLHDVLFAGLGLEPESATDGTVLYRSDPDELRRMIGAREVAAGFFLPPMSPAEFAAAIAHGELLPPKSTRFLPKVYSGLVWAGHDSAVL